MNNKDLFSRMALIDGYGPIVLTADNTPVAIDLRGYRSAVIVLGIGIGGITFDATNKVEIKVTESNDDSVYTAVAQGAILGATVTAGGIIKSLIAAHAAANWYRFGYIGGKRYLKLLADFSGTHGTGTPLAAVVIGGNPLSHPVAADA